MQETQRILPSGIDLSQILHNFGDSQTPSEWTQVEQVEPQLRPASARNFAYCKYQAQEEQYSVNN